MSEFDRTLAVEVIDQATNYGRIKNKVKPELGDIQSELVLVIGHFGPHSPHTFAAAPMMLDTLRHLAETSGDENVVRKALAAIAAAEGK